MAQPWPARFLLCDRLPIGPGKMLLLNLCTQPAEKSIPAGPCLLILERYLVRVKADYGHSSHDRLRIAI